MSLQSVWQTCFHFLSGKPVVVEVADEALSSDAGLLPIRQFDEVLGLTADFAAALDDPRSPGLVGHSFLEMTRSRIYGILADYADQNDHDTLRSDPVFKLIAGRLPDDEAYADRGESENRNKELKRGLSADRLSDHRYMANLFRLYLHAAAYNLLVRVRRAVADPPPEIVPAEVPREALSPREKKRYFNRRRQRDPLGEGHPCTWRTHLIKVAARLSKRTSRGGALSSSWPYLDFYARVSQHALSARRGLPPAPD